MEIIKYEGNDKYFFALIKEKEKNYLFAGKVNDITIDTEKDEVSFWPETIKYVRNIYSKLEISFQMREDNSLFKLFELSSEKEYETIISVVKSLL